jgi:hypothetical protein
MPKQKDLKRLTRSRMQKTGESYTTARARLLEKRERSKTPPVPAPRAPRAPAAENADYAALAGMSDEAVRARTGCAWDKWVYVLDAKGAASWPHREIAEYVHETYKVSGWWAQTVTVGYERIKGLREIGQRRSGSYEANKSKTLPVPLARLYRAWRDRRLRARWLPGVELTVRKATPERSMRITWDDGTSVEVGFFAKGDAKSQLQVQHSKLASKADAEARKAYWAERLAALAAMIAGQSA